MRRDTTAAAPGPAAHRMPRTGPGERGVRTAWSIRRRIADLDPVRDNEEVTRLSFGVLYADAFFVHAAYTVAFARQMSIPSISRVVHRRGTGDLVVDARRRNDHTLLFFGEMIRSGHSGEAGRAAIERMERIHSRFGITDEDKLYTLASLAFEPTRILDHLGLRLFTHAEKVAHYHFWRGVGEYMGLPVPTTAEAFRAWTLDYERRHSATTEGGCAVVAALFGDWRTRWFPGPLGRFADPALLLLLDRPLRRVHRLPDPPAWLDRRSGPLFAPYLALQGNRPHRMDRSWVEHFGGRRGAPLDLSRLGHRAPERPGPDGKPFPARPDGRIAWPDAPETTNSRSGLE
ncbi:oxygenase MpaB family protein [Amycolatopsis sp. PS_44_ISF1]|uniref:oxygenase MpaB family protein n=1 Tax=Amycolatopsis sp. PS_44_ISF1 TaxID=2974917 RepID=UPI0028DE7BB0|nr:oxygenase MpaB family protein [Amycolatopsis sp. PS_44_ISF1]MDT8913001.1 DUF2236 domain-containing protein [Amycolatopsis sp. PS_44_ISF1]